MIETLTAILVIITAFYAWITFKILKANEFVLEEMRMQHETLIRPYISISTIIYSDNPIFFLQIHNTGRSSAENLKLTIDKDFYKFGNKTEDNNLRNLSAFNNNIECFVSDAKMLFYLAQSFVVFGENASEDITPSVFTITAKYEYFGKSKCEKTIIDLRPYLNSASPHDPIVQKLRDIKESIDKKKFTK